MAQPLDVVIVDSPFDIFATGASIAGIVGLFLAIWAIVIAKKQAREAERDAAKERRTVFELGILRDLIPLVQDRQSDAVRNPLVVTLLGALPQNDLPLL